MVSSLQIGIFLLRALGAGFLFFGGLYVAYAVAARFFGNQGIGMKWCAVVSLWLWSSSLLSLSLLAVRMFRFETALSAVLLAVVITRWLGFRFRDFTNRMVRDAAVLRKIPISKPALFLIPFLLPLLFTAMRTLFLPPLGWDFFTDHGVKAGMWVQTGGHALMDASGGWSMHRNNFGGGEILIAWAMLPFRGDLLAGFSNAFAWMLTGLVLFVLGRESGLNFALNVSAVLYCLTLPALWLSVGSGYEEPLLNLLLLLGFLFVVRFIRNHDGPSLLLGLLSLGTAAGVKITAWPILFWATVFLSCQVLFLKNGRPVRIRWFLSGLAGVVLILSPWILWNLHNTGFPFGDIPLSIFGIKLGRMNEALTWYRDRPEWWRPFHLREEWWALLTMFRWPFQATPHVDRLTVVPAMLFIIAVFRFFRNQRALAVLALGWIACVVGSFYHPNFSMVRLIWASSSSRFLIPAVLPMVFLGASVVKKESVLGRAFIGFLLTVVFVRTCVMPFYGLARGEMAVLSVSCVVTLLIACLFFIWKSKPLLKISVSAIMILALLTAIQFARNRFRYRALMQSTVFHDFPRYWIPSAEKTDNPSKAFRIAVTSGPYQDLDNWYMYSFMGSRLQNRLFYIPVTRSGRIMPFSPDNSFKQSACFDSWLFRIQNDRIQYVMSFFPTSVELEWMEAKPDSFERIEGDRKTWGLYRIRQ